MKKILCGLCICVSLWAGDWVMFSDGEDTYIYSTNTGEIYIRHHLGKKNYEDVFIKMPRGMQPNELKGSQSAIYTPTTPKVDDGRVKNMQLDALKKSQEMLNAAIE